MLAIPHLPASTALNDPSHGHAVRAAREAAQRAAEHDPAAAYTHGRLRRDALRPELGEPVERTAEDPRAPVRTPIDARELLGRATTGLFFVQRFAQEEIPAGRPATPYETAAAAYPSLDFDDDILLPGEAVPVGWVSAPRLDILV